jgi:hypothetical protein
VRFPAAALFTGLGSPKKPLIFKCAHAVVPIKNSLNAIRSALRNYRYEHSKKIWKILKDSFAPIVSPVL